MLLFSQLIFQIGIICVAYILESIVIYSDSQIQNKPDRLYKYILKYCYKS